MRAQEIDLNLLCMSITKITIWANVYRTYTYTIQAQCTHSHTHCHHHPIRIQFICAEHKSGEKIFINGEKDTVNIQYIQIQKGVRRNRCTMLRLAVQLFQMKFVIIFDLTHSYEVQLTNSSFKYACLCIFRCLVFEPSVVVVGTHAFVRIREKKLFLYLFGIFN